MTAIRRKRDDDSTFYSNSQCSESLAFEVSSMSQADDSTRRRNKRRRTIVEQLEQINLNRDVPDQAILMEQTVLDNNEDNNSLTSSEDEGGENNNDNDSQLGGQHQQQQPLTELELAQKAVMRQLVFGRPPPPPPKDPVDRRLQDLLRQSLEMANRGEVPIVTTAQDDMSIDTSYTRPSPEFERAMPVRQRSNSLPLSGGGAEDDSMELL